MSKDFMTEYEERKKKIEKALADHEQRYEQNLENSLNDFTSKVNKEIETAKTVSSPTWGKDSLKNTLEATRQSRVNIDKLLNEAESYRSYLGDEKTNSVVELLKKMKSAYDSHLSTAEVMSGFKDENEYNKWYKRYQEDERIKNLDIDATTKELEALKLEKTKYENAVKVAQSVINAPFNANASFNSQRSLSNEEWLKMNDPLGILGLTINDRPRNVYGENALHQRKVEAYTAIAEGGKVDSTKLTEYDDRISAMERDITNATRIQNGIALHNDAINAEDFEKYAQEGIGKETKYVAGMLWGNGNDIVAYRGEAGAAAEAQAFRSGAKTPEIVTIARNMTEKEVNIYSYYFAKYGEKKAEEYLDSITETVNSRIANDRFTNYLKGNTLNELIFGVEAGLDQFASGLENLFSTEDYIPQSATQMTSETVREDLADDGFKTPKWMGGSSIGQMGYDAITTTSNMMPSILTSVVVSTFNPVAGSVVGSTMMGASAAGNAYAEMLNLGYSKDQARGYALLVGGSEALLQTVVGGIGSLGGKAITSMGANKVGGLLTNGVAETLLKNVDNAFARFAIKYGTSMIAEGGEEYLQEILDPVFRNLMFDENNKVKLVSADAIYSGILGALSAGMLEGVSIAVGEINTYQTGKTIKGIDGAVNRLAEIGTTFSADSVAYRLASKVDENTGAYTIGRLFMEEGAVLTEQNINSITNALIEGEVDEENAKKLAEAFASVVEGAELTAKQKEILENCEPLTSAIRESIIGENTTVYQRTSSYNQVYNDALMELAKKKTGAKTEKSEKAAPASAQAKAAPASAGTTEEMVAKESTPVSSDMGEVQTEQEQEFVEESLELVSYEDSSVDDSDFEARRSGESDEEYGNRLAEFLIRKYPVKNKNVSSSKASTVAKVAPQKVETAIEHSAPKAEKKTVKSSTPKEALGVKDEYTYNGDGKTTLKSSGKEVSIKEIASIKDGDVVLTLENGETVNAREVNFSSADTAVIYEAVANMGVNAVVGQAIVDNFDPSSASAVMYALGVKEAYNYGYRGFKADAMSNKLFASSLTEAQRDLAHRLGQSDATAKAKEEQAVIDEHKAEMEEVGKTQKKKGRVFFEGDRKALDKVQKKSLAVLDKVANALGYDFHIFESYEDENGNRVMKTADGEVVSAPNGWYDPTTGEIYLDLYAGQNGHNTILFTAAHELTHAIKEWSPAKYETFKNFLLEEYGKRGISVEQLVANQIAKAKDNGRDIGYDEALEEVVADSCESFLADSNALERIARLKAKDESLWNKIKTEIESLLRKIKALYKELAPDSDEGKYVRQMKDTLEELHALWTDALIDAGESYSALGVALDMRSESLSPTFSERTWRGSDYVVHRDQMAKKISEALGVSLKKAKSYIDDINSIARLIANDRVRLDYEASSFGSAFVSNVEYGGSFDYTTLCKKRRIYTGTFTEIQKRLKDVALTPDEILTIRNLMIEEGIEATCGLCYVEGSRANMGKFAKEFIRLYKRDNPTAWIPNMADVNTPDGVEQMRINHPEAYERYEYFWNHYGKLQDSDPALFASQQKPKLYEARKEYKGEILEHFSKDGSVEKKNLNGGIRMQSFSDFEIVHLIDTMQVIMDMSTVGLAGQAYTKVPEFAKAFGNTGLKINLSLIAKGVDENGKLIFDDREGMPHQTAFDLRKEYSKNVGTIIVTFTDEQLLAAMADPRIDYIIPFHRSQWKKGQYGAMGLPKGTKDYTYMQNEKLIKKTYHEYRGRMVLDKASNYMPNEYWDFSKSGKENAEAYLKMCAENNKRPKFYKLLDHDGNGTYSLKKDGSTDGYWKLLIDFKMYDNEGVGSPQMAVTPMFNMEESKAMLEEYKGGHSQYPVASGVVDKFVNQYNKDHKTKYSQRDSKGNALSKEQQEFFKDSKVRDKNGNLLVCYHSTDADFTVFDKNKIGSGNGGALFGRGFYFAISADLSKDYGGKIGEYYLNIKNPFEYYDFSKELVVDMLEKSGYDYDKQFIDSYDFDNAWDDDFIDDVLSEALKGKNPYAEFDKIVRNYGFDGVWAGEEIIAFEPEQIKLTTNKTPTNNPDIRYSERSKTNTSNRGILVNALDGAAQNDIEKNALAKYKAKVDEINAEEATLLELRKQIHDLSFTKVAEGKKKDTAKIRELQDEATMSANRIHTFDRQLLSLEATAPIKNLLQREKELVRKRTEQKGKEALKEYREKSWERQETALEKQRQMFLASKERAEERSTKTGMRRKIKKIVTDLNTLLLHGTKDKHVPIGLQNAVAMALDAINMDTVDADTRIAEYDERISKATDPIVIESLKKSRDYIAMQGDNMKAKLSALRDAYSNIKNDPDPDIANAHDEVIEAQIGAVMDKVGSTPLRNMTLDQLEAVYDLYKMVYTRIRNANQLFKAEKAETISTYANRAMEEVEKVGGSKKYVIKNLKGIKGFSWNALKPSYAFKLIGSSTLSKLFDSIRSGEDSWAVDVSEARAYYLDKAKKYGYKNWDLKKQFTFTSKNGNQFSLSLEQMMALYAYSKRPQAIDHLEKGGIVFDDAIEVVQKKHGVPIKYNVNISNPHNLSEDTIREIIGTLTNEQRGYVDEMQSYLSNEMGAKGNEVSVAMYGVKLFKEKFYFPLKSAKQFIYEQNDVAGEVKIKNSSFSKETVDHANNPIILSNFTEVWANHVNDMSMYHSFVLPLEDFNRVFNYKTPMHETLSTESVKQYIQNAYGTQANAYIKQLLTDLNGGARVDSTAGFINKMMGVFKKGSVFASASVVIQQPSSIARALAYVDAKHFVFVPSLKNHNAVWGEVKKYAPVAIIKEMGYFDTNMGRQTVEWITATKYEGFKEKFGALFTDSGYRDEILSKAPALADELAWCHIWNAVKNEIKSTTDLKVGSEEYFKRVGERFTEVVINTQVYDSVLSRSAMMRSKDTGMKMVTAFMAEPTTSLNMMADAIIQGKRGNKAYAAKTLGAVTASMILNSILVSFVYAARDDDEDKTYLEKYTGTLVAELIDGFNPLNLIPFVKDIVSIFQGYDVERTDLSSISNIWNSIKYLDSDSRSTYRKVEDLAGSIANLFGLPVKNIMRDARGLYNVVMSVINGEKTTMAGLGQAIKESVTGKADSNSQQLYDAILSGDKVQIARVKGRFKDQKAIESALREGLAENDKRVQEAVMAHYNGDPKKRVSIATEIVGEGHFTQNIVIGAINNAITNFKTKIKNAVTAKNLGKTEEYNKIVKELRKQYPRDFVEKMLGETIPEEIEESVEKELSYYKVADYYTYATEGDDYLAQEAKENVIATDIANGKSRKDAETKFFKDFREAVGDKYKLGELSEKEAVNLLYRYGGNTNTEATSKVKYWAFQVDYPDYSLAESTVKNYYDEVEPYGINVDTFYDYYSRKKEGGYTKRDDILRVINSMPLTSAQKDALYFYEDLAKSTLYEAPWH